MDFDGLELDVPSGAQEARGGKREENDQGAFMTERVFAPFPGDRRGKGIPFICGSFADAGAADQPSKEVRVKSGRTSMPRASKA